MTRYSTTKPHPLSMGEALHRLRRNQSAIFPAKSRSACYSIMRQAGAYGLRSGSRFKTEQLLCIATTTHLTSYAVRVTRI